MNCENALRDGQTPARAGADILMGSKLVLYVVVLRKLTFIRSVALVRPLHAAH